LEYFNLILAAASIFKPGSFSGSSFSPSKEMMDKITDYKVNAGDQPWQLFFS
jgi:hypothetical protein